MIRYSFPRRNYVSLTAAALGGLLAGTSMSGCNEQPAKSPSGSASKTAMNAEAPMSADMHGCKGLNGCKGHGAGGANACAGQGGCASAAMKHDCKGKNACKGQGGCGETAGMNMCKGMGGCAVPMKDESGWKKARENFESKMKAQGKAVGNAPA